MDPWEQGEWQDYYKILRIDLEAGPALVRIAYQMLAARYDPDKNQHPDTNTTFDQINLAFEVLGDPETRARYDQEYRRRAQANEAASRPSSASQRPMAPPDRQPNSGQSGRPRRQPSAPPNPNLKLIAGAALVVFAIAFSLIMFPRLNNQLQELERNATPRPVATRVP